MHKRIVLKNGIKIYIKIYIKTTATCFVLGAVCLLQHTYSNEGLTTYAATPPD
jgi:hypothetical protein